MPKKEVVEPELDFGPSLSGDEIERLAREERDWSKREAERLMRLEEDTQLKKERVASGQRSPGRSTSSVRSPHLTYRCFLELGLIEFPSFTV